MILLGVRFLRTGGVGMLRMMEQAPEEHHMHAVGVDAMDANS